MTLDTGHSMNTIIIYGEKYILQLRKENTTSDSVIVEECRNKMKLVKLCNVLFNIHTFELYKKKFKNTKFRMPQVLCEQGR